jgi:16S rRNA (cytosine1402-N4)-methyltransferase
MIEKIKNDKHITVLLEEAVNALNIQKGNIIVDATLGAGGHTLKILEEVGSNGCVIAFDLDKKAIEDFIKSENIKVDNYEDDLWRCLGGRLILVNDNFKNIKKVLSRLYARGCVKFDKVNAVLADLGWRIEQVQDKRYGMSFQSEMPLDMRMSPETQRLTAAEIINEWSEKELAEVFNELGGEGYFEAKKIAKEIVERRESEKIETTIQLAELVADVKSNARLGVNHIPQVWRINPATKVFQALRITVNEELSNLNKFLKNSFDVLENKGRLVIISFHSLEDRLVKKFFRAKTRGCVCPKELPVCVCKRERQARIIQRKVIKESEKILKDNPRARSARMRILEKK